MFTLIIIAIGMHSMSGNTVVSVDHVDGFTSEQRCKEAARLVTANTKVADADAHCVQK